MNTTIQELSKVTLEVSAANGEREGMVVSFIYGLGTDGLTPFEGLLADKKVGDLVVMEVKPLVADLFFGEVLPQLHPLFADGAAVCNLKAVVTDVRQADNREVVKALAGQVSHCGSGSCGCGCS